MEQKSDSWIMKQHKYEIELIQYIKKYKWMRWSHVDWNILSFKRGIVYDYDLRESPEVAEAFEQNRSQGVNYLLQKWIKSDNPTLQIAAMRMIAAEEDRQRLSQQYVDHTTKGNQVNNIDYTKISNEALQEIHQAIKKDEPNTNSE
jgi:hypothetical protein